MECKINVEEGPLRAEPAGKQDKNTAVIHLTNQCGGGEVGVHINTTLSIAWFRKTRALFALSAVLSAGCLLATCLLTLHYLTELSALRQQLELLHDPAPAPAALRHQWSDHQPRADPHLKKYYVEDLEHDLHFTNVRNKGGEEVGGAPAFVREGVVVAHFVGGGVEKFLGNDTIVGPWQADLNSSSPRLDELFTLVDHRRVKVHQSGLYLIYAQLAYVTSAPSSFTLWVWEGAEGRPLSTCASGDVGARRPLHSALISCAVQTAARLAPGDLLNFAQRERNVTVDLRPGFSYFGLVRLSS